MLPLPLPLPYSGTASGATVVPREGGQDAAEAVSAGETVLTAPVLKRVAAVTRLEDGQNRPRLAKLVGEGRGGGNALHPLFVLVSSLVERTLQVSWTAWRGMALIRGWWTLLQATFFSFFSPAAENEEARQVSVKADEVECGSGPTQARFRHGLMNVER